MSTDLIVSPNEEGTLRAVDIGVDKRRSAPEPFIRRFPPVLQFLTMTSTVVEQQLKTVAKQAYSRGRDIEGICEELGDYASSLGYEATIAVQEVYSSSMPSFPNQTIMTALVLLDLSKFCNSSDGDMPYFRYAS